MDTEPLTIDVPKRVAEDFVGSNPLSHHRAELEIGNRIQQALAEERRQRRRPPFVARDKVRHVDSPEGPADSTCIVVSDERDGKVTIVGPGPGPGNGADFGAETVTGVAAADLVRSDGSVHASVRRRAEAEMAS